MTNNPTIDGVSRELIEQSEAAFKSLLSQIQDGDEDGDYWRARLKQRRDQLRALLDTPAVERKPKGAILRFREYVGKGQGGRDLWRDWTEWSTGTVEYAKSKLDQTKDLTHIQFEVEWLYSDPPEVAALQSTIARLEARVADLESVRGDPAAWVHPKYLKQPKDGFQLAIDATLTQMASAQVPLFTAPPAPVAVVLPARRPDIDSEDPALLMAVATWNACLDATVALNGVKK